ncbi:hypothetical protein LCGC14_2399740, partial [marine sediment metagenome]
MDPVILADILTVIAIIVIGGPLAWLTVIWAGRAVARKRARLGEPETRSAREIARHLAGQIEPDNC